MRGRLYVVGVLVLLLGAIIGGGTGVIAQGYEHFSGSGSEGPAPSVPPHPSADTPPQPRHHAPVFTSQDPSTLLPGRIIVELKEGVDFHAFDTDLQEIHGRDNNPAMPESTVRVIIVPPGTEQAAISVLKKNPNVKEVHQDHFIRVD